MTFVIAMTATAVLAFGAGLLLPWWGVALAAGLVAYVVKQRPMMSAGAAFLGVSLLWIAHATWIDAANQHLLSRRVATLLPLDGSSAALIIVTGLAGGIVGAMSGMTGALLRNLRPGSAHVSRRVGGSQ